MLYALRLTPHALGNSNTLCRNSQLDILKHRTRSMKGAKLPLCKIIHYYYFSMFFYDKTIYPIECPSRPHIKKTYCIHFLGGIFNSFFLSFVPFSFSFPFFFSFFCCCCHSLGVRVGVGVWVCVLGFITRVPIHQCLTVIIISHQELTVAQLK